MRIDLPKYMDFRSPDPQYSDCSDLNADPSTVCVAHSRPFRSADFAADR